MPGKELHVHIAGHISDLKGVKASKTLSVDARILSGTSWAIASGIDSVSEAFDIPKLSWIKSICGSPTIGANVKISASYATDSLAGWPRIAVAVHSTDMLGKRTLVGYASSHVPPSPGSHVVTLHLFRPVAVTSSDVMASCASFCGAEANIKDSDVLAAHSADRDRIVMKACNATVQFAVNVAFSKLSVTTDLFSHRAPVNGCPDSICSLSTDGSLVVGTYDYDSGSISRTGKLWRCIAPASGAAPQFVDVLSLEGGILELLSIAPDRFVAALSNGTVIEVLSGANDRSDPTVDLNILRRFDCNANTVVVSVAHFEGELASIDIKGTVWIHDIESPSETARFSLPCHDPAYETWTLGYIGRNTVATGSDDRSMCLVDTKSGTLIKRYPELHPGGVSCIKRLSTFSEFEFLTGGYDGVLSLWDSRKIGKGLQVQTTKCGGPIWRMKESNDGSFVVLSCCRGGAEIRSLHDLFGSRSVWRLPDAPDCLIYDTVPTLDGFASVAFYEKSVFFWDQSNAH